MGRFSVFLKQCRQSRKALPQLLDGITQLSGRDCLLLDSFPEAVELAKLGRAVKAVRLAVLLHDLILHGLGEDVSKADEAAINVFDHVLLRACDKAEGDESSVNACGINSNSCLLGDRGSGVEAHKAL